MCAGLTRVEIERSPDIIRRMDMGVPDSLRAALVERLELGRRVVKEYQYVTTEMLRRSTVWHRIVSSSARRRNRYYRQPTIANKNNYTCGVANGSQLTLTVPNAPGVRGTERASGTALVVPLLLSR